MLCRSQLAGENRRKRYIREQSRSYRACIIAAFANSSETIMEAEQLNTLSNQLQDLGLRSAELRRYL